MTDPCFLGCTRDIITHVFIITHVSHHGVFCPISLNKFLSPDPDPNHFRGGTSHGHNTSCVKKIKSPGVIVSVMSQQVLLMCCS